MSTIPSRIKQLPDDLITRIAAGEVVDRPASVIKELVENSIDAGATRILIEIEAAGRNRILISDNGSGMTKEEALLALKRHATSKINCLEDLEALQTFGFRGEAVPSIASVSKFKLATRFSQEEIGWEFVVEGGKVISETPIAREPGTTIEVNELFFNTPARFKFLKTDATERSQCLKVIEEIVFGSPQVSFQIKIEANKPSNFQGKNNEPLETLRNRIAEAWGGRWDNQIRSVQSQGQHFQVHGFVTDPSFSQATPKYQYLYINRRPVQNRRLARAIYDAYTGQLFTGRHPGWVLFLEVDPASVDVNVHPTKREVKLTHESELYGFLLNAVKSSLQGSEGSGVQLFQSESRPSSEQWKPIFSGGTPSRVSPANFISPQAIEASLDQLYQRLPEDKSVATLDPEDLRMLDLRDPDLKFICQIRQTFILAESKVALLVIDQHAAAEKVAYEKLMSNFTSAKPAVQMQLVPFTWEVSFNVSPLVENNLQVFNKLGYLIEPFGKQTFLVKGVPAHLNPNLDLHSLLDGISDILGDPTDKRGGIERNIEHRMAAMTACKASVKAGDVLSPLECQALLKQLPECRNPFTCPHGRPTVIRIPFNDLEVRFRRT
ncbi:MAG: DNA mismatch repair endonuclease MutL [Elusimicrobiota bacterium]